MATRGPNPSISIPVPTGGINRFFRDATPDQAAEALNVWDRDGRLMRRPAFQTISHAVGFDLPADLVYLIEDADGNLTEFTLFTAFPLAVADIKASRVWIGCREAFDGIRWPFVLDHPTDPSGNARSLVHYRNTDGNAVFAGRVYDSTIKRVTYNGDTYLLPWCQQGTIVWHRSEFTGWGLSTLKGYSRYWISLTVSANGEDVPLLYPATAPEFSFDGEPFAFLLQPVNGLNFMKLQGTRGMLFVGGDRQPARTKTELGASIGIVADLAAMPESLRLVEDEGAGTFGTVAIPSWTGGGGGVDRGNIFEYVLEKDDQSYDWISAGADIFAVGQFMGGLLAEGTCSLGSNDERVLATGYADEDWAGLFVLLETDGAFHEIVRTDSNGIYISDKYPFATPAALGVKFWIRSMPCFIRTREGNRNYQVWINSEHTIAKEVTFPTNELAAEDREVNVNFEVFKLPRWRLHPNAFWRTCYNSATGRVLVYNGRNPIMEFDGHRMRTLEALWDDTEGVFGAATVILWRGTVASAATASGSVAVEDGSLLHRAPPLARLLVEFNGRLVAVRPDGRIQWSAPAPDNNLWPFLYNTFLRDQYSNDVVGMAVMAGRLYAWTVTSIWATEGANDLGILMFQQVSNGLGFAGHECVAPVGFGGGGLIGPSADGLILVTPQGPQYLIDDWRRLLAAGVNTKRLDKSVAAYWAQEGIYFLAFSPGGDETNSHLLVYRVAARRAWVWDAPWGGITSICKQFAQTGEEQIVFGFADGQIANLVWDAKDCLSDIEGSFRTRPFDLNGQRFNPVGIEFSVAGLAANDPATVSTYANTSAATKQETSQDYGPTEDVFDTATFDAATFSEGAASVKRTPTPPFTATHIAVGLRASGRFIVEGIKVFFDDKGDRLG